MTDDIQLTTRLLGFDGEDPKLLAVFWEAMHSLSTFTARALGQASI